VFTITERDRKSYWILIGAAIANRDGSKTVLLDALPVKAGFRSENGKPPGKQLRGRRRPRPSPPVDCLPAVAHILSIALTNFKLLDRL